MADIIDAFVAELRLDPKQYYDEIKKFREDRKRTAEEDEKYNRRAEDTQRRAADGIRRVRNETAGFLLMLAGANSVKQFVGDMLTADAQTGRFAANIGMATERVAVWEEALKRAGGTSQDAQASLRALTAIFQNYQLLGDNSKSGDLAYFGLRERDLQNPEEAMLKLAQRGEGLKGKDRAEFTTRLNRLGLNDATVTLLSKGRKELEALLTEVEKTGVATDESAKAAQELDASLARLSQTIKGLARPYIKQLADGLNGIADDQKNWNDTIEIANDLLSVQAWLLKPVIVAFTTLKEVIGAAAQAYLDWKHATLGKEHGEVAIPLDQANGSAGAVWNGSNVRSATGRPVSAETLRMANSGAGTGGALATGSGARSAATVEQYFRNKGFSADQARGITAAVVAEGGLNQRTGGGYKGRTIGIGQLLGSRRAKFLKRYGDNFTLQNELDFFYEEMHNGDGGNVGGRIKQSRDSAAISRLMVDQFYRPAKGAETTGDYGRAARYLRTPSGAASGKPIASNTSNSTTTIGAVNVYTSASNGEGIARDIRGELAKRDMVVQSTSGLKA